MSILWDAPPIGAIIAAKFALAARIGGRGPLKTKMPSVLIDPIQNLPAANEPSPHSEPVRARNGWANWNWVLLLFVLAAIPRLVISARPTPVCDDAYIYLAVAEALDRGATETALWYLNVNIYPVLLVAFKALGLSVLPAAKFWGAALGALTILPLFGWIRRILDRQTAVAVCLIYAMHPEFIEICAEPIRDATFWFLVALSLYLCHRVAHERRAIWFAAAGMAVALAAHTRTEGWLLALPMVAWPALQVWRESWPARAKTAAGILLACGMSPLLLVAFNLSVLRGHPDWEFGKLEHFQMVIAWLDPGAEPGNATRPILSSGPGEDETPRKAAPVPIPDELAWLKKINRPRALPGTVHLISEFADSVVQSLKPIPLVLMLIGAIAGWRLLIRPENLVLSAIFGAVFLAVWIRLATVGEINGRYFLTCFFPAAGSLGMGLVAIFGLLRRCAARFTRPQVAAWSAASILAGVGLLHVGDVIAGGHPSRSREARIGRMLAEELGGELEIIALPRAARVGFYADAEMPTVILDQTPIDSLAARFHSNVAIFEHEFTPGRHCANLAARLIDRGWRLYDITHIPDSEHFLVLVNSNREPNSRKPTKTAHSMRPERPNNR